MSTKRAASETAVSDGLAKRRAQELIDLVVETHRAYFNGLFVMRQNGDATVDDVKKRLQRFMWFSRAFPRFISNVHNKCPEFEVRRALVANMYEEEVHDADLGNYHVGQQLKEAKAMGLTDAEIADESVVSPTMVACLQAWDNLTRTRSWQAGLAAVACLELTNSIEFRQRLDLPSVRDIQRQSGGNVELVKSSLHHEAKDEEHGSEELEDLCRFITNDDLWQEVRRTTRESCMIFAAFLENIYRHVRTDEKF